MAKKMPVYICMYGCVCLCAWLHVCMYAFPEVPKEVIAKNNYMNVKKLNALLCLRSNSIVIFLYMLYM